MLKEAAIHFLSSQLFTLLNYETLLLNFHWLGKHVEKIRSSHQGSEAMLPEKIFCWCLENRGKLAHRENEILVLFCTASATDMFTIYTESKTTVYVKHALLDISIKVWFESNKSLLCSSNQKLLLLLKKYFFFKFLYKKN